MELSGIERKLQRELVKGTVAQQIRCPLSKEILDYRSAVVIGCQRDGKTRHVAVTGDVWDTREADFRKNASDTGITITEVIDGRKLK